MPSFEEHCKECKQKLGYAYPHVHRFLDKYAKKYNYSKRHRKILHNKKGIELVEKKWGKRAKQAAILHIQADEKENPYDIVRSFSSYRKSPEYRSNTRLRLPVHKK